MRLLGATSRLRECHKVRGLAFALDRANVLRLYLAQD